MNIFLTGACGYKGTVLVPKLLAAGHQVTAFDIMWFDNHLAPAPGLTVVQGDIRDADQLDLSGFDAVFGRKRSLLRLKSSTHLGDFMLSDYAASR